MQTFFLLLSSPRAFHIFPSNSRSQLVLYLAKKKKKKKSSREGVQQDSEWGDTVHSRSALWEGKGMGETL